MIGDILITYNNTLGKYCHARVIMRRSKRSKKGSPQNKEFFNISQMFKIIFDTNIINF